MESLFKCITYKREFEERKVLDDAKCSACLSAQENTLHAIWDCEMLHQIWAPCFNWIRTEHPRVHDAQDLIHLVGQRVNSLELFAVVAWFIWNHRNRLRLNEKGLAMNIIFWSNKNLPLELFVLMLGERIKPNCITFLSLLSAYGHSGLVREGCEVYNSMKWIFGTQPDLEHYTCMVDLLGRCGKLKRP